MLPRLSTYLPTALLAFLIFWFGFHALTGDRGLLSARQRQLALAEKQQELSQVRARAVGVGKPRSVSAQR